MVLEGHVGCPSIPGSCMRLDVSPALMFSCQFSKLFCMHPGCEHSDLAHGAKLESTPQAICSELTVVMDPVQDVTEISTDKSKVVISSAFHPLAKGLVLFFILDVQYVL